MSRVASIVIISIFRIFTFKAVGFFIAFFFIVPISPSEFSIFFLSISLIFLISPFIFVILFFIFFIRPLSSIVIFFTSPALSLLLIYL